jgi:hypothetical protein
MTTTQRLTCPTFAECERREQIKEMVADGDIWGLADMLHQEQMESIFLDAAHKESLDGRHITPREYR